MSINGKTIPFPQQWDELSAAQLTFLAGLFSKKLNTFQFRTNLVLNFLRLSPHRAARISDEDLWGLTGLVDFVFKEITLTKNLIPRIRSWHGPADGLRDCTFGEFTRVQMKMEDFIASGDDKDLDELAAILYRRKKPFWFIRKHFSDSSDCRRKFTEKQHPERTRRMARADRAEKYAVFLFVNGVLGSLPEKFPNVYRKKGGNKEHKGGWASLIISLADGRTDDESLDRVFYSNMYNVFMGLEAKATEYFDFLKNSKQDD